MILCLMIYLIAEWKSRTKLRGRKWKGSRSKRKTNKKVDNEMDIFQISRGYRTYNSEKGESKVRNTEYGRDSPEDIEYKERDKNAYL